MSTLLLFELQLELFLPVGRQQDSYGNVTAVQSKKDRKRTHMSDALGYLVYHEFGAGKAGGLVAAMAW